MFLCLERAEDHLFFMRLRLHSLLQTALHSLYLIGLELWYCHDDEFERSILEVTKVKQVC